MGDCVCSGCKNLKRIMDGDNGEENYECKFGFPSDKCEQCEEEDCDITCLNYEEDNDEVNFIAVNCKSCGKELKKIHTDDPEGEVFCVDCYLERESL